MLIATLLLGFPPARLLKKRIRSMGSVRNRRLERTERQGHFAKITMRVGSGLWRSVANLSALNGAIIPER